MKVKSLLVILCTLHHSISMMAQDSNPFLQQISSDEEALVKSNIAFAVRLFQESNPSKSIVLSPLSVTCAMTMVNNGATGMTRQEILDVLGGASDTDIMNNFCRKVLGEAGKLDSQVQVKMANTIFFNQRLGLKLKKLFCQKVKDNFDVTPQVLDFADENTLKVINQWASDYTDGMILQILHDGDFSPEAVSYLLNALCFKAPWKTPFNPNKTKDMPFDKGRTTVQMMETTGYYYYKETDLFQYVELPYGEGTFQLSVFLPKEGKSIDEILSGFGANPDMTSGVELSTVNVRIPRFSVKTDLDLTGVMKTLGVKNAFEGGEGFGGFCYKGDDETNSANVFITKVKQGSMIDVNEYGCEAGAVTVTEMHGGANDNDKILFNANHPFMFLISETSTGLILFIGQYMGEPATSLIGTHPDAVNKETTPIYSLSGQRLQATPQRGIYVKNRKKFIIR